MRIIGGQFKGRKLCTVRGLKTRPTSDRLRETVFNILGSRVHGTTVLDLFAGTGALGIEALSRGATMAIFVDKSSQALAAIARNIDLCGIKAYTRVLKWDIARNLNCLKALGTRIHLVLMDPPYDRHFVAPTLRHLHHSQSLANDAWLVVEHAASEPIPATPTPFVLTDQRDYGRTRITFLQYRA